jgi:isoleucyl-tRNA synthetase
MSEAKKSYKDTLFLPQTQFPMRANLKEREPQILAAWKNLDLYHAMQRARKTEPFFVLHDGPPYANGAIHHGHCLNKILKDICVKFKHLSGFQIDYVPGWDCHGLPIEHAVETQEKISLLNSDRSNIRKHCRAYAQRFFELQKSQFQRLGVIGDFEHPYLTMAPPYEAKDLEILASFVKKGMVYRKKKPVHWSWACQTSLAGNEIEYHEITNPAIYVICPVSNRNSVLKDGLKGSSVVFWTTTPWSIPAVLGISVHADHEYGAFDSPMGTLILAAERKAAVEKDTGTLLGNPKWSGKGGDLEHAEFINPLTGARMPVLLGDHVTLEVGTGCVSTAPGHGEDDYQVGLKYGLDIYCPIGPDGTFTDQVAAFEGLNAFRANPKIIETLESQKALLAQSTVTHSYPHCWRSKTPAVMRATEQWFIDFHGSPLGEFSRREIGNVTWTPAWGELRMQKMLEHRPDWCISRQRAWGVPIPSLVCETCKEETLSERGCLEAADKFRRHTADYWDLAPLEDIFSDGVRLCGSCGSSKVSKGHNILDVWFDSGISFASVIKDRLGVSKADLYLEGNDQYRGWFQTSLLAAYGYQDTAPYKAVLTHGMILDEGGNKFSKSSKNYQPSEVFIQTHGADVLRVWAASEDFQEDLTFSLQNIERVQDAYRKIRNTFRFMLGVLSKEKDYGRMPSLAHPLHRYMMIRTTHWLSDLHEAYESYSFTRVYRAFTQFFTTELSNFYLDILKDTLYCDPPDTDFRKEAISVIGYITTWACHFLAPIASFLAEDVFEHVPLPSRAPSIFLSPLRLKEGIPSLPEFPLEAQFGAILALRDQVLVACEPLRNAKQIKTNNQAFIRLEGEFPRELQGHIKDLPLYFNVSEVQIVSQAKPLSVHASVSPHPKCARCWRYLPDVSPETELCHRCQYAVQ